MHTLRDLLLFTKAQPSETVEGFAKDVLADLLGDIGYPLSAEDVRTHDRVHLWHKDDGFTFSDKDYSREVFTGGHFGILSHFRSLEDKFTVFLDTVRKVDDAV